MHDQGELALKQAADLLNVSLPFLESLVERGVLSCKLYENGQRARVADVMAYKRQAGANSEAVLRELAALSQELKLGS